MAGVQKDSYKSLKAADIRRLCFIIGESMKTLYVIQVQDGDESRELCNCMEYSPSEVGFVGSFAHLEEEHAELKNRVCEAIERQLAKPTLESVLVGCSKENPLRARRNSGSDG